MFGHVKAPLSTGLTLGTARVLRINQNGVVRDDRFSRDNLAAPVCASKAQDQPPH